MLVTGKASPNTIISLAYKADKAADRASLEMEKRVLKKSAIIEN